MLLTPISLWNPVFHVCDSFPRARALEFHPNVPQGLRHVVKTSSSATASHPQWSSGAWLRRWTDNLRSWGSSLGEFQVVVSINFYFYLYLQWYLGGIIHTEFFCGVVSTSQRDCQYGGNPPCPQGFGFRFDDIWFTTKRSTFLESWTACPMCSNENSWLRFLSWVVFFNSRWWFQRFLSFTRIWGKFPFWLIFFKWVENTN